MVTRVSDCQPELLQSLLDEQLSAADQTSVTLHLEQCDTCRQSLETLAAGEDWWNEASSFLSEEDSDDSLTSNNAGISSGDVIVSPLSTVESSIGNVPLDFLEPSDSPAMMGRLGDYDIMEPIGCGGMGVVLKGYDSRLNRFVAVKVLAPHYATSAAARKRFAREAQAAAAVVHPHVLAIHSVDATGRLPFLVMPFLDGESLQERVRRNGPLGLAEVLRIGAQSARGLQAAHEQGLVHRDIKPGNILLERGVDRAVLTDFGLARAVDDASMTRSGVIAGTPQFMSPEQARGEPVDCRSDLFSLGSVLYTMCAGRPPFRADTTMGLLRKIVDEQPRSLCEVNSDVPAWLAAIVERLHSKDPSERFESAGALSELLERCLAHVQQPTVIPLPETLPTRLPRRRSAKVFRLAGTTVAVAAIAGLFLPPGTLSWPEATESGAPRDSSVVQEKVFDEIISRKQTSSTNPDTDATESLNLPVQESELAWQSEIDLELRLLNLSVKQLENDLLEDSITDDELPTLPSHKVDLE